MSRNDDLDGDRDVGELLGGDVAGPPPELDARIRAYARERIAAAPPRPDAAPGASRAAAVPWRRVLPVAAVVALAATLVPLANRDGPSRTAPEASRIEAADAFADADVTAEAEPVPTAPLVERAGDRALERAAARSATSAATPAATLEARERREVAAEPVPMGREAKASDAVPASARRSARAVVALLRGNAPDERVARALEDWSERWPDVEFGAVSGASRAELEALREIAPSAARDAP